jgi:hypothetical protein
LLIVKDETSFDLFSRWIASHSIATGPPVDSKDILPYYLSSGVLMDLPVVVPLLCPIPFLTLTAWKIVLFGLLGDYVIVTLLTYLCLSVWVRFLKRRVRQTPLPPPPAPFTG